jgi:hypothetical protein
MTRWLVLGATGTVGRPLTAILAGRPDTSVVAVSRNRVLLDELNERLGCEIVECDVASPGATVEQLPAADVVVDLTYAGGRHPRAVVRKAERAAGLIRAYLDRHATARLVHTGTWVLVQRRPNDSERVISDLDWTSTYTLSKSAAERAFARNWQDGRMRVVRLGNVVTPDSMWGVALLRALRAGTIESDAALASAANVCGLDAVIRAVDDPDGAPVALAASSAAWTWGEVLASTAHAVVQRGGAPCGGWDTFSVGAAPDGRAAAIPRQSLALRALSALPLQLDAVRVDAIPGWAALGPVLKRVLGSLEVPPTFRLPPGLPTEGAMPGAGRNSHELEGMAAALSEAYMDRGYFPWARRGAERSHL